MIYNEDAYYTGYYRNVRALGAIPALVFDTIAWLLRTSNGIGEISNSTLMELLGIKSKSNLWKIINELIEAGYIEKKSGDGRGNISIYYITEKGSQNVPFMQKKGSQNHQKGFSKSSKRVLESHPLNTDINKELKESDGDTRETVSHTLSTTTTFFEKDNLESKNEMSMTEFDEFWSLYPGDPDWAHEKESCENFWRYMREEWRKKLIEQLRAGLRWRVRENDNPIWYLRNYQGEDVRAELPFVRNGSAQIDKWQRAGETICVMMYDGRVAYCLAESRAVMESAGAQYLRDF